MHVARLLLFTLGLLQIHATRAVKEPQWWKLIQMTKFNSSFHNHFKTWYPFLERRQRNIVQRQKNLLKIFASALELASMECQLIFKGHKWNCAVNRESKGRVFGLVTKRACRETAFLYALISAACVIKVAQACSAGLLPYCSCDPRRRGPGGPDWEWVGCSDNIPYGVRLTRKFLDSTERGHDLRTTMNRHNNEAGRAHVRAVAKPRCRCDPGPFGSCQNRNYCERDAPNLSVVSRRLFRRFNCASRLIPLPPGRQKRHLTPRKKDLVYLEDSPDFCHGELVGSSPVSGKRCDVPGSASLLDCRQMCCHGYEGLDQEESKQCNCRLVNRHHFQVICDTCTRHIKQYFCL